MSIRNGLPEQIKLSATLAAELNPSSPVILAGDPAERISLASSLGYDAIELHWADPAHIPFAEIASACKENHMGISALATGRAYVQEGLSLIHEDHDNRAAAIKRLKDYVDAASPFEAIVIIGCIRGNLSSETSRQASLERLAHSTQVIAEYAQSRNVGIVFEAINRFENNYLNTAQETIAFIRENGLVNTKILLDTFHMNIEDADMTKAILDCGDLLGYIHIADSNRHYAGAGHINLKEIINSLIAVNYQGYISAECLPLPNSETALSGWIQGVKNAFDGGK
ncbi:MAG TPA: sugar phosphate isomerase/epimerase family protein [Anaerovoracaceae bacterium]|nr:sugar phosphate isomerase/epimerase family protein [Anaerovoracaceae bacterium]